MTDSMLTTPKYHPDARFLTDYSAGSLPASQALCVASHLHYCGHCRARVRELQELGAALFMHQQPVAVAAGTFDRLLARLPQDNGANTPADHTVAEPRAVEKIPGAMDKLPRATNKLPRAIDKLCKGNPETLRWRGIGKRFRYALLQLGDAQRETSLLHIRAGAAVPRHRHQGDEITVVLQGSFSDNEDKYMIGDFIVRTPGEIHKPVASQDEDCLCLSTLDAPIQVSNWLLRLLMPILDPRPSPHSASRH